jgi:ClpP class serine protease
MPSWNELLNDLRTKGSTQDIIRRQALNSLHEVTGRNVVIYYSGWLQKPMAPGLHVSDADKNGFMAVVYGLDRSKGLDLLLHTPGGETAATESLVDYLRAMFGTDIRAIVPQLAMSAGTMIACAAKQIVMGKHSSLGPIDPQLNGRPAHGVVEEFNRAHAEMKADATRAYVWQPILQKYTPAFIGECEKAIEWSIEMTKDWLKSGMFEGQQDVQKTVDAIISELADHSVTKSHARHLSLKRCQEIGLHVVPLESDQRLQEAVLSVHHACILTLASTRAFKIIENHKGVAAMSAMQSFPNPQVPTQAPTGDYLDS